MSGLLEQIGFKKRTHVGISLSANNFVELVCIDKNTKSVVKYASGNIKYNNAIREIIDYDEFTEVLEGLFEEAGLDPQECAVTLNLPNVHFGITTMDNESEEPFIIENLQSEIEDLYIFKRNEPEIRHCNFDSKKGRGQKNVLFSAVQTKVIVKLIEIFDSLQCELVKIDTSYSSLLKAIQFCDRFARYVQKEEKTAILLITANSCSTFYLEGNVVNDLFEEPLAVKSFSSEEVYSTISKIAANTISKNSPQSLLIISETDEVNSELLASRLEFSGEIDCINKNLNTNDQFIEVSGIGSDIDANMISYMTIESVGAAASSYDDYPLDLNFLPDERIGKNVVSVGPYEVELKNLATACILTGIIVGLLIGLGGKLILDSLTNSLSEDASSSKRKVKVFKERINKSEKSKDKSIFPVLKQIIDNNTAVLDTYNALSTSIPDEVYIKKFVTTSEGGIGIIGEAETSEQVSAFLKGLKETKGDLSLMKISLNTPEDPVPAKIQDGFTFEIKTKDHDVYLYDDYEPVEMEQQVPAPNNNRQQNNKKNSGNKRSMTPPPPII
ncbi:PilN domain-containing protein [bacterium]|nr:PilN domain-containing protein [bacterium]